MTFEPLLEKSLTDSLSNYTGNNPLNKIGRDEKGWIFAPATLGATIGLTAGDPSALLTLKSVSLTLTVVASSSAITGTIDGIIDINKNENNNNENNINSNKVDNSEKNTKSQEDEDKNADDKKITE